MGMGGKDAKNKGEWSHENSQSRPVYIAAQSQSEKIVHLRCLFYNSGFFKEIFRDSCPHHSSSWCKHHFQIFSKTAGIVIDGSACISKGFHQRVDLQNFLSQGLIICLCQTRTVRRSLQKHYFNRAATQGPPTPPSPQISHLSSGGRTPFGEISINHQHCFLR